MSKAKISAARAASLKVKTQSIASKLPETRNADGSVKERDKTGGKGTAVVPAGKLTVTKGKPVKAGTVNSGDEWTDGMDKALADQFKAGKPIAQIAKTLGRTLGGIEARLSRLGLLSPQDPVGQAIAAAINKPGNGQHAETLPQVVAPALTAPANAGKDWTDADDQTVRDEVAKGTAPEKIAAALGRSPESVRGRIDKLGIFKVKTPAKEKAEAEPLAPTQVLDLPYNLLAAALAIAPKGDTRYYLNGVFVHQLADRTLRIVATDGHRLFVASIAYDKQIDWAQAGVIIPREEFDRVLKFIGKDAKAVRILFGLKHPSLHIFEVDGIGRFEIKPIDGKYPDYQRVADASAAVFTQEREGLSAVTLDSAYLKAAGAIAAVLGSRGVIPYLAEANSSTASVIAFADTPNALLYIMGQRNDQVVLPAPTIKLFGTEAMQGTLAQLEAQIEKTRANAKAARHDKFREQFAAKAERLQARADALRASLSVKLTGPAPKAPAADSTPAAGVAVH